MPLQALSSKGASDLTEQKAGSIYTSILLLTKHLKVGKR